MQCAGRSAAGGWLDVLLGTLPGHAWVGALSGLLGLTATLESGEKLSWLAHYNPYRGRIEVRRPVVFELVVVRAGLGLSTVRLATQLGEDIAR